ncbi:MAG TPA: hypothetical protein VEL70_05285 [Candidatus Acidoferrum sp.]|nr:hypothetical protein [Candidatus Acidoferrum sp.]
MINYKPPSWFRSLQIGIGIIALVLSFLMISLGYPTLSLNIINIFVSITLLTIGIERVVSGLMLPAIARQSMGITKIGRFTSIGMGTIATIFAIIALSSPQFASTKNFTLLSLSISVIFNGFGKIVQGVLDRRDTLPIKVFLISLGILSLAIAFLVGHADQFGTIFLTRILSIVLILYGMQMIFFGITGKPALQKMLKK